MALPILKASNLSFSYADGKKALSKINLIIPQGSRTAFIGPNGAGKSTLLLLFNGILRPSDGTLEIGGEKYSYSKKGITNLRKRVGFVFQDHEAQLFAGTVLDDVLFGPMNLGMSLNQAEQAALTALQEVSMAEYVNSPLHFLSYGQKKRVAIAGVLAMNPQIVLMDEPTAGLDYPGMKDLSNIMEKLHRLGKTLIVSTHDIEWAWSWADLVFVLNNGHLVIHGAPEEVLIRKDHQRLGFAKSIIGTIYSYIKNQCFEQNRIRPKNVDELISLFAVKDE